MKELSIEEKAKRYDEAIEKIQKYVKDGYGCTRLRPEDIFPELKESDDERVRKELLSFFIERAKYTEDSTFNGLSSKEIISWLEKQGEHKSSWNEEDETNLRRTEYAVMKFFGGDCSLVGWLRKSLKERYTWKPSDEQIKALVEALVFAANCESPHLHDYIFGILKNLTRQLKKLRGEII